MGQFGIGQSVTRIEDLRLLTGGGNYADNVQLANESHAFVLRSPHAHAELGAIDTAAAQAAPGVLLILTGADLKTDNISPMPCMFPVKNLDDTDNIKPERPVLALGKVRHVGQPVALIVAETLDQARDAAELIEIDYNPLAAATDTFRTTLNGAAQLHDDAPNNICFDWGKGDQAATEAAFAKAAHVTTLELINNRVVVNPMEPRAAICDYDTASDRLTLYTSSQGTHVIRNALAESILNIDTERLRVVTGDVGGGFGMKTHPYPEQVLVLVAAKRIGRTVRWISDRTEAFLSDLHGRDHISDCELAMDKDGKFLAVRVKTVANIGAYSCSAGVSVPTQIGPKILTSVYDVPHADVEVRCVVTNTAPVGPYRGDLCDGKAGGCCCPRPRHRPAGDPATKSDRQ